MAYIKKADRVDAVASGQGEEKKQISDSVKSPVVVIWNHPRVRLVQFPVESNGRSISKAVRLNPGANTISAKVWDELKKRKRTQAQLKKGELRLVTDQGGESIQKIPRNLEGLTDDEALVLIDNMMDETTLQSWTKSEQRENVLKAIKDQLEKIAAVASSGDE